MPFQKGNRLGKKFQKGKKHHNWRGDNVGYVGMHLRIYKKHGAPNYCEFCMKTDKKRYEWANISDKYHEDFCDWLRLCNSCHQFFDNSKK